MLIDAKAKSDAIAGLSTGKLNGFSNLVLQSLERDCPMRFLGLFFGLYGFI
jgi:hypothetical protein